MTNPPATANPPRRRDRARTRAALLDAAAAVFARKGFDAASLDEIAENAGFTRGAVHHHFASKDELFVEVIARRDAELLADYGPNIVESMPPDPTARAALWRALHADDHQEVALRLELHSRALRSDELRERVVAVDNAAVSATIAGLARAAKQHGVRWRYPLEHLAELSHMVSHALSERAVLTGSDTSPQMETFLALVWGEAIKQT